MKSLQFSSFTHGQADEHADVSCLLLRVCPTEKVSSELYSASVSAQTLLSLQLVSGGYASISHDKVNLPIRLFTSPNNDETDTITLSPFLQSILEIDLTQSTHVSCYKLVHTPTADQVLLERVSNIYAQDQSQADIDLDTQFLTAYFTSTPLRVLSHNLLIPTTPHIFYRCSSTHPTTFFQVNPHSTRLSINQSPSATVHSKCPYPLIDLSHSPSLTNAFNHLHACIRPKGLSCVLLLGKRRAGKRRLCRAFACSQGLSYVETNTFSLLRDTDSHTVKSLQEFCSKALAVRPCLVHLRRAGALQLHSKAGGRDAGLHGPALGLREMLKLIPQVIEEEEQHQIVFVISAESLEQVAAELRALCTYTIQVQDPAESERKSMLHNSRGSDETAKATSGMSRGAMRNLIGCLHDNHVSPQEIVEAIKAKGAELGVAQVPDTRWEDIGGLQHAKRDILDALELPIKHKHLMDASTIPSRAGLLLFGPPGTGKTLLAKAVATECAYSFIAVKGPELLNMYVGESEANVRRVFQRAREASPCVLFFDELDALAPYRGKGNDSGGVSDRVVSQLLAELDNKGNCSSSDDSSESNGRVFVLAATNRPDLVDPGLLRPGRLDRCVYLGVDTGPEGKVSILRALTRKMHVAGEMDWEQFVSKCPPNLSGADLYALVSDALLLAMSRKIAEVDKGLEQVNAARSAEGLKGLSTNTYLAQLPEQDLSPVVMEQDFVRALEKISPSVSEAELEHYRRLAKQFG